MFTFSIHLALLIIAGNSTTQNQVADFKLSKNQSALIEQKSLSLLAEKKQHSISYFSLEPDMVLSVSTSNSKKLLFVSFNANEGSDGTMRIFVSQLPIKKLVMKSATPSHLKNPAISHKQKPLLKQ